MRRKNKTPVVTTLTTPTQNCGRATKSTVWKILFLILGITVALLYRKTDAETELAAKLEGLSEELSSQYLRLEIQSWLERKKRDIEALLIGNAYHRATDDKRQK